MEPYLLFSYLNDFIFCPRSIYFHQLYGRLNKSMYQRKVQIAGTEAHRKVDSQKHSSRKTILQGIEVYCDQYNLCGKIDTFDTLSGRLTERKRSILHLYDGYIFQIYAQYFGLKEMGYTVKSLTLYDITKNKHHPILLPERNPEMLWKFERLIRDINSFSLFEKGFVPELAKCQKCIYANLCDYSLC